MVHKFTPFAVAAALLALALGGCSPSPPPDGTPPAVRFTEPADGARGVRKDVVLRIHFSEPMDPGCTEAAYDGYGAGLRPDEVGFRWDDPQTLVVTPHGPLAYSDDENDKTYVFVIRETACDLAGNPMTAPRAVRFYVLRRLTGTLHSEAGLDGYVLSSGRVDTAGDDLGAGDGPHGEYGQAFLSFDLGELNPDPVEVVTAHLVLRKATVTGDPGRGLGGLLVEHVYFGPGLDRLGVGALELEPLAAKDPCGFDDFSPVLYGCWKAAEVQDDVDHWLTRNGRSQFRIRFEQHENGNAAEDSIMFYSGDAAQDPPELDLVYYGP